MNSAFESDVLQNIQRSLLWSCKCKSTRQRRRLGQMQWRIIPDVCALPPGVTHEF